MIWISEGSSVDRKVSNPRYALSWTLSTVTLPRTLKKSERLKVTRHKFLTPHVLCSGFTSNNVTWTNKEIRRSKVSRHKGFYPQACFLLDLQQQGFTPCKFFMEMALEMKLLLQLVLIGLGTCQSWVCYSKFQSNCTSKN